MSRNGAAPTGSKNIPAKFLFSVGKETSTTIASKINDVNPNHTFRINSGMLQISFNATNIPSSFNAHTISRF